MSERKKLEEKSLLRGELWLANLNPRKGKEPGKLRPVLIIQSDFLNIVKHPTCAILPISSQVQQENALRFLLQNKDLKINSYVLIDQIRTLDVEKRMIARLGQITEDEMQVIEQRLKDFLDLK